MDIIGFAGRKRSGKSVLANLLKDEFNAKILSVANYLKYLCCDLLNVSYDKLNEMKDDNTPLDIFPDERWCRIISVRTGIPVSTVHNTIGCVKITSVRQMLQVIGTDLIRRFYPEWHIDQLLKDAETYPDDVIIVVDDVRFPNEVNAIETKGGQIFYIMRPDNMDISNHISETSLKWQNFSPSHVLINNVSLEEYKAQFKMKFVNNFDINICGGIFLSDNIDYQTDYENFINQSHNNNNPLIKESLKIFKS